MPDVSIVLPVFNAEPHLSSALPRLLDQTLPDVEIVIVDDGSTDETPSIAAAFADSRDNVRFVRQPTNGGVALARRAGVANSSGDFVWFVDADDGWPDGAAAAMHREAVRSGVDVLVAAARIVTAGGPERQLTPPPHQPVGGVEAFRMMLGGVITGHLWNKLFRRSLLERIQYTPAPVHSDLAMVADALAHAGTVGFTNEVVYDYRIRPGSIITTQRSRAASLRMVGEAVEHSASRLSSELLDSDDFRYFRTRYVVLSSIKDGVLGPYSPVESKRILHSWRRELSFGDLAVFARRRDTRRLLLGVTARTCLPAYRAVLSLADR